MSTLRIATRKSPLALWQAHHVRDILQAQYPDLDIELLEMSTQGDKILDTPLAKIGGKGLFVKELEQALYDKSADIAVHSMKDVPAMLPEGLVLPVIMSRASPFDAFVSEKYHKISELPQGAVVGTASLRRQSQLLAHRPDLQIKSLRGNVGTRLQKLADGEFDAIILATAGLERLGLADRIRQVIPAEQMLPGIGQGALGIECRSADLRVLELIHFLKDAETEIAVGAERAMNRLLAGSCQTPIGGFATFQNQQLHVRGLVASVDGKRLLQAEIQGDPADYQNLGETVAHDLLAQGAGDIIENLAEQ